MFCSFEIYDCTSTTLWLLPPSLIFSFSWPTFSETCFASFNTTLIRRCSCEARNFVGVFLCFYLLTLCSVLTTSHMKGACFLIYKWKHKEEYDVNKNFSNQLTSNTTFGTLWLMSCWSSAFLWGPVGTSLKKINNEESSNEPWLQGMFEMMVTSGPNEGRLGMESGRFA